MMIDSVSTISIWIVWIAFVIAFWLAAMRSIKRVRVINPGWIGNIVEPIKKDPIDGSWIISRKTLWFLLSLKYRELGDRRLNTYGNIALLAFIVQWIVFAWIFIDGFFKTGSGTILS